MIWILLGFFLARLELVVTAKHYRNRYAGIGAIGWTINKTAPAPMRYRVLVPWIIKAINGRLDTVLAYQIIQWLSISFALWAVSIAWSPSVAILTACMIPITYQFDYWNWPIELGCLALGMTGMFAPALIAGILLALSKETAPIVAVAYWSVTKDWGGSIAIMATIAAVMIAVRLIQGRAELYCERWMLWQNLRELLKWRDQKPVIFGSQIATVIVSSMILLMAISKLGFIMIPPLLIFVAGWILAKSDEIRIFVSTFPWVAAWLISLMS